MSAPLLPHVSPDYLMGSTHVLPYCLHKCTPLTFNSLCPSVKVSLVPVQFFLCTVCELQRKALITYTNVSAFHLIFQQLWQADIYTEISSQLRFCNQ